MKLKALILNTFRELIAKVTLLVIAAFSTGILVFMAVALSVKQDSLGTIVTLLGNELGPPLSPESLIEFVKMMQWGFANGLYSGIVLFGVFATAGILPDLLEKGAVDLYLSKPLSRWELISGKYIGAITVMFANVLYFIGALWIVIGLKVGVWNANFLLSIFSLTFTFACLYTIVTFFGVITRSTAISIIGAFAYLFIISPLLFNREQTLFLFLKDDISRKIVDTLYNILPQISALQEDLKTQIIDGSFTWKPFIQSAVSSAIIFLGASEILKRKDF